MYNAPTPVGVFSISYNIFLYSYGIFMYFKVVGGNLNFWIHRIDRNVAQIPIVVLKNSIDDQLIIPEWKFQKTLLFEVLLYGFISFTFQG